jgi:hypothetical protein
LLPNFSICRFIRKESGKNKMKKNKTCKTYEENKNHEQ